MNESNSAQDTKQKEFVHRFIDAGLVIRLAEHISENFDDSIAPDIHLDTKVINHRWFDLSFVTPVQMREINTEVTGRPYNLNPMPAWFLQQEDHVPERRLFRHSRFIYTGILLLRSGELVQFKQSMVDKHDKNSQNENIKYKVLNASTMQEPLMIKELLTDFANR